MKYFSLYPINIFSAGAAAQPPGGRAPLLRPRLLAARPRGLQRQEGLQRSGEESPRRQGNSTSTPRTTPPTSQRNLEF